MRAPTNLLLRYAPRIPMRGILFCKALWLAVAQPRG